ncbi:peptidase C14 caspase catalytic subunit p20 [Tolypothrix tenuis PCC 7101]|uniref:Peptidase C14 caspase catalytic subunit p20 n=1 Tax=Tolypothrix tenuis PCC 7101 TaxID=231146 RepID=A0A1Z4MYJ6_9CYAN|nr:caspase family protein [Aulosira sp. FACHB-113]BAY98554.1 peptidase C14 caspase catalytic subunit p20 [Tolypothrix tenuis PCC 7101]BAZ77527.1 peptidase C14 caspase catalytic subunit p20 [Aulosira laxa NIES-50]
MPPIGISTGRKVQNQDNNSPKLWLMLVGVNQYQEAQLPNLNYSAIDCQGLAEALTEATSQFAQKNLRIYHDFAVDLPSLANIRHSLQEITSAAAPGDTILFYFSGHGIVDDQSQEVFLCLGDTQKSDLVNTGLALQELLQLLAKGGVQHQLVWLDACHSGGMTLRGAVRENFLNPTPKLVEILQQKAAKSKGFYALLSCDNDQQSWEFAELGHGVFTYYLMRGLQGEAANNQGLISVDSLYRYVYHQTLQYIDKTNQQLRLINQQKRGKGETKLYSEYPLQTPKRIVEGVGELILGKRQNSDSGLHRRLGIVVEGLGNSQITLDISKFLGNTGDFTVEYLPASKASAENIKAAIAHHLQQPQAELTLLYLRGRIEETEAGEWLLLGEDTRIKRSSFKQLLCQCPSQQVIIFDCPVGSTSLGDWLEELQIDSHHGQCLIGYTSPKAAPEYFAQKFLDILTSAAKPEGLSAAGAIAQLQLSLADSQTPLHVWLSGTQGIIEILTANTDIHPKQQTVGLDLGVCPYMGLNAFVEADSAYFYGRENVTQQLIHHLRDRAFLAVIGASGSGKSSVVQAGLIPQLRQGKQIPNSEQWLIKTIRPGANPLQALAKLGEWGTGNEIQHSSHLVMEGILHQGIEGFVYWLRTLPQPMTVLVVDQFEELFTLAPAPDRDLFLQLLLGAVEYASDRFKLIITLRADFIARCLEFPPLASALQIASVLVPPKLSLDDYRRVILNPAAQVGLKVEPELVEVLLRELNQSVGDLPLLEFVLEQLWQHRTDGKLTLQTYQEQLGGIKGALERACQSVYESLPPEAQECAKWIFLSLTQLGEGKEDTRRRIYKSDLIVKKYPVNLVEKTLNALTTAKLVVVNIEAETTKEPQGNKGTNINASFPITHSPITIEVAHEILIRHWSTLRWWLEENRDRLRKQRQITHACQLWQQSGKQTDFLLQGVRLAEAEDIYIKWTDELAADVQDFISACLAARKQQQIQEKNRLKQAQRAVVALSILGIAAVSFGGLAYWKSQAAQLREIEALNASTKANLLSHQQLEALLASVKAAKQLNNTIGAPADIQTQTFNTLQQTISSSQERNRFQGHNAEVLTVSVSSDGQTIASGSYDQTIILWKRDGTKLRVLNGHHGAIRTLSFSPDGKTLASGSFDKTVKIWRVSDGKILQTFPGHQAEILSLSWAKNGQIIATGSADGTARLWNVNDGKLVRIFPLGNTWVNSVSLSLDGQLLAIATKDGKVTLSRTTDASVFKTISAHQAAVTSVTFSPDGETFASASEDKTVKLWRKDGTLIHTIAAHEAEVLNVQFSPDGKILASSSTDSSIKLWNTSDATLRQTILGHTIAVYGVSFTPDSQTLVSAGADKTVRLWQVDNTLWKTLSTSQGQVYSVSFHPNGKTLASAGENTNIKIWRLDTGTVSQTLQGYATSIYGHSAPIYNLAFSPDGEILASASSDHFIKLWRTRDGYMIKTLQSHQQSVNSLSFHPQQPILASASADKTVKIWNFTKQTLITTLTSHSDEVLSVTFSPDGQTLASAGRDNTIKLWRVKDWQLLHTLTGHTNPINALAFSPDSQTLASASSDKTIKLWRVQDGVLRQTLNGHNDAVWGVSFSPNGKFIASASSDKTVKIWTSTGTQWKTFLGHHDAVLSLSFSPNHQFLASASFDGTVKIWRLDNAELQTLNLHSLLNRSCTLLHDYLTTNSQLSHQEKYDLCPH